MSRHEESQNESAAPVTQHTMTLGLNELQALITAAVKAAKESESSSQDNLAAAILKSREPYEKPQDKANRQAARKSMIQSRKDQQRAIRFNQDEVCKHVQGSNANSTRRSTDSAFFKMLLDTGETIGVCSNCQKVISSLNHADFPLFQMGGGNIQAAAGYSSRFFADPLKAQRARLGLDQKELVLNADGDLVESPTAEELAQAAEQESVPAE
jgi:hypothetical protein